MSAEVYDPLHEVRREAVVVVYWSNDGRGPFRAIVKDEADAAAVTRNIQEPGARAESIPVTEIVRYERRSPNSVLNERSSDK